MIINSKSGVISIFCKNIYWVDLEIINYDDRSISTIGNGYSTISKDLAYEKALSELIERIAFIDVPIFVNGIHYIADDKLYKWNTIGYTYLKGYEKNIPICKLTPHNNFLEKGLLKKSIGFSAHPNKSSAIENSCFELIERLITSHISYRLINCNLINLNIINDIWGHDCSGVRSYLVDAFNGKYVISSIKIGKFMGWGASFNIDIEDAVTNSIMEAIILSYGLKTYEFRATGCTRYPNYPKINNYDYLLDNICWVERSSIYLDGKPRVICQALFVD